jgi:putative hydrolase of the HAD superfamily
MRFTTVFFDLDDTVYPSTSGLWNAIGERMNQYMCDVLQIPDDEVPTLRKHYFDTYGTTLRGLQRHYGVDADDYLVYVHDLPLKEYIHPDPLVCQVIASLPQKKWIFTNADEAHALRVLRELELDGLFDGIIDVRRSNWACKPEPDAYRLAMEIAGERDPGRCVLLEDSLRNLAPARKIGFTTVLVSPEDPETNEHIWVRSAVELRQKMPELWDDGNANQRAYG